MQRQNKTLKKSQDTRKKWMKASSRTLKKDWTKSKEPLKRECCESSLALIDSRTWLTLWKSWSILNMIESLRKSKNSWIEVPVTHLKKAKIHIRGKKMQDKLPRKKRCRKYKRCNHQWTYVNKLLLNFNIVLNPTTRTSLIKLFSLYLTK